MSNKKILIVASDYYKDITNNLIEGAKYVFRSEVEVTLDIHKTNGSYEIPFIISRNLEKFDGFIALGCIIRGETYHFELIANEVSRKIMDLSIQSNKPIGFGIITCENMSQAKARSNKIATYPDSQKTNKGIEAAAVAFNYFIR